MHVMKYLLSVLLVIGFAACKDVPKAEKLSPPSFSNLPVYELDVSEINMIEEYVSSFKSPNVEHAFATPPAAGVKIWTKDRLRKLGKQNRLDITIKDASVTETPLQKTKGIKGAFTNDQAFRYDAKLVVEMRIYAPDDTFAKARINVSTNASKTIAENATLQDRERLYHSITDELLKNFNAQVEDNITQYFRNFLLN